MNRILLVEDRKNLRTSLRMQLENGLYEVSEAASVGDARSRFDLSTFDLILTDLRMPGEPGTALIRLAAPVPVVVMTAYGSIENAVAAMRLGAEDYIEKSPSMVDELRVKLRKWLPKYDLARVLIGSSPQMCALRQRICTLARKRSKGWVVLIQGETGTGKELVAGALHKLSARAEKPLVTVNCGALPETMIESELFGYRRGAFSGADFGKEGYFREADGGTLFLDEVGELSIRAQAKLLRALEQGTVRPLGFDEDVTVDARVVLATLRDLSDEVDAGSFRTDLYFRLERLRIEIPPLRERAGDISELAMHFLRCHAEENEQPLRTPTEHAINALVAYPWPGNVRELRNAIERAADAAHGDITSDLFTLRSPSSGPPRRSSSSDPVAATPRARGRAEEDRYITANHLQKSQRQMANELGVSAALVNRRIRALGLREPSCDDE